MEGTNPRPTGGKWGDDAPGSDFFFVASRERPPVETSRPSVAVFGFKDASGNAVDAELSSSLTETLTTELAAGERLRTIPEEDVDRVKNDLKIEDVPGFTSDTLSRIRRILGPAHIVSGSFTASGTASLKPSAGPIRIDLRLQSPGSDEMISDSLRGSQADLPDLIRRAAAWVRVRLNVRPPSEEEVSSTEKALLRDNAPAYCPIVLQHPPILV